MSLRNQVILFGAMGMVWYIIIAVLALVDTGTIALEFFKPSNMPYEKYRWFEPYQLFLFGIAGMITGAALWRLRDMRRSTKTLILQSALVCLAATCSFWLARGPELLLQKLTRSHLWHVMPHERATKPEQIIAQRRLD